MATTTEEYLAVLKASYDYDAQSEDEISIKENQMLFLLQAVDEDWWKVKVKGDSQEEVTPVGLVPAAYVEPPSHKSVVKALYDYEANAPGELSVKEDEILLVFDEEEDWLLVQSQTEGGKAGFVPGNYVELSSLDDDSQISPELSASAIVVPPSPPPVVSNYQDPADRVASTSNKAKADDIKTWSVSEVDKKGKKKKGTLGVGNGAVFFASESDKTPVRKWQTSEIDQVSVEKSKHVHVSFGGSDPISLHFNAGSKDTAEAILDKMQSSRAMSEPASSVTPRDTARTPSHPDAIDHDKSRRSGASVHFSDASPDIIPTREYEEYETPVVKSDEDAREGEGAVALYDFDADGEDELSVREGESLLVVERDSDEWWKCRNNEGAEGVVPASYLELNSAVSASLEPEVDIATTDDTREAEEERERIAAEAEREASERAKRERATKERAAAERDRAEKEQAERERANKKRLEQENAEKERAEKERAERVKVEAQRRAQAAAQRRPEVNKSTSSNSSVSHRSSGETSGTAHGSSDGNRPPAGKTRIWHDRSGQFRVEAAFLGFSNGKIRLHKINGVVVEVPIEKMSVEDMRYVEKITGRKKTTATSRGPDDDDESLADRRKSLQTNDSQRRSSPAKKAPQVDWFEFFLSAGCDVDDCTRYASSFERDKIDEAILFDITDSTMRSLGLREGDIIRVTRAIQKKTQSQTSNSGRREQMLRDEEYARQLQAEENALNSSRKHGETSPAPNLFAGPGGTLKNNTVRRGRPQPSKTLPPATVDLNAIATASDQIQRTISPQATSQSDSTTTLPSSSTPQSNSGQRSNSALVPTSGFDDDAWTNRPSSARPSVATPPSTTARAPSAPPATAPSRPQAAVPAPQTQKSVPSLAATTEADIFDQLSRLSQLKVNKASPTIPASAPPSINTAPTNFQHAPQTIQSQQITPVAQVTQSLVGPRGPFAPVPVNQGLLQPLIPTTPSFNAFVPTRVANMTSPFQSQQPPPPVFLATNPTGFPTQPMITQPTGVPAGGFQLGTPFIANGFGAIQTQPTGFNPALGTLNGGTPLVPTLLTQPDATSPANVFAQMKSGGPMTSIPSPPPSNTSPANVFAQMKSGTFAVGNEQSNPQPADKYNALRSNPIAFQPTGWAYQGTNYQTGFTGY